MKRILIDTDKAKIHQYNRDANTKLELFNSLLLEATTHIGLITLEDTESLLNCPLTHLETAIQTANPMSIPIKIDKLLFLLDIDLKPFKALLKEYKRNPVKLTFTDNEVQAIRPKELGETYTETESQNKRYKELNNLLEAFKTAFKVETLTDGTIHNQRMLQQLQALSKGAYTFYQGGDLKPNAYNILQH